MQDLIGKSLLECEQILTKAKTPFVVIENNHNVEGDTKLVTNAKVGQDGVVVLTVGEFIFDLKD